MNKNSLFPSSKDNNLEKFAESPCNPSLLPGPTAQITVKCAQKRQNTDGRLDSADDDGHAKNQHSTAERAALCVTPSHSQQSNSLYAESYASCIHFSFSEVALKSHPPMKLDSEMAISILRSNCRPVKLVQS